MADYGVPPNPPYVPPQFVAASGRGRRQSLSHVVRSLYRPAVVVVNRDRRQIDAFDAAGIDGRYLITRRTDALAVGRDAAGGAEAMFDHMFVEQIGRRVLLRRQQPHRAARHEPQQRALTLADRAVARGEPVDLALGFELHLAAMAASLICHVMPPVDRVEKVGHPRSSSLIRRHCQA